MRTWICALLLGWLGPAASDPVAATEVPLDQPALRVVAEDIVREAGDHRLVLLGEKHGTREIPLLVSRLLDLWSSSGSVSLLLEIPRDEQRALDRYLASDGGERAKAALRRSTFWSQAHGNQHDGRRSRDMLALVEHARDLASQGRSVRVFAYDRASNEAMDHHARDRAMAEHVARLHRSGASARTVVLAGNVHAMLHRPEGAPPGMQLSMGWHLRELQPFSIDIVARQGHFWACNQGRCGPAASLAPSSSRVLQGAEFHYQAVVPAFTVARLLGTD